MLNLKTIKEAREDFEKIVSDTITEAQKNGISTVYFENLPDTIKNELKKLGYPAEYTGSRGYQVTVL